MALNNYYSEDYQVSDIIEDNLYDLQEKLKKEKVDVEIEDFKYSFFDRGENLYVASDLIYPGEDLPKNFGVNRGYSGGGMHGNLYQTDLYKMKKTRQAKAERLLALFRLTFWNILKEVDLTDEETTGEEKPDWERLTI